MDQKKFAEDRRMSAANFTWSVLEYLDLCKGRAHPSYTVIRNVAKVIVWLKTQQITTCLKY